MLLTVISCYSWLFMVIHLFKPTPVTVLSSIYTTYAHNNQKFGHSLRFFFKSMRGHERRKNLMDSHPYSYETSIFSLGAPHEKVQGRQTQITQVLL